MEDNRYSLVRHFIEVALYLVVMWIAIYFVGKYAFKTIFDLQYVAIPIMFFLFDVVLVFLLRAKTSMTHQNRFSLFKGVRVVALIALIIYLFKFTQIEKVQMAVAFILFYFLYLYIEVKTYQRFGRE